MTARTYSRNVDPNSAHKLRATGTDYVWNNFFVKKINDIFGMKF